MKRFNDWYDNLDLEDVTWLVAIFFSAMFGTLMSSLVMRLGMAQFGDSGMLARILVSVIATAVYAGVVYLLFYALFPKARPALKRIIVRKHRK